MMNRRNFIKHTATAATVIGGHPLYADHTNPMVQALMEMMYNTDRVLIIIQQNGGNDGLNTIFPLDQYDNLKAARSNMLMPATSILKLTDKTGIHPAMEGVYNLFKDGKAGVVQSVGYPSFNYSHFRATDIWLTGSDADEYLDSGWAGRYLNYEYPNYPVGFPNTTMPDPLAIRVGESVGLGLQMMGVNMGISINSASDPLDLKGSIFKEPATNNYVGKELSYLREVQRQTDKFGDVIVAAYSKSATKSTKYPANSLANQGVKELILIAQDLTYYGLDIYKKRNLTELVDKLSDIKGIEWIRLHYAYPSGFPMDVLDVMKERENICNYLDMPLQHISDKMLKSMRRGITREKSIELVKRIRETIPEIALRTTLIAGYPGETEEDYLEMKEWVEQSRFDRLGIFTYSHEENTHAFQLTDDVPDEVKKERAAGIMDVQQIISRELNEKKVGNTYRVLFDRKEGNFFVGRSEFDSPEVDNEILVDAKEQYVRIGDFANIRITAAQEFDLFGEVVN